MTVEELIAKWWGKPGGQEHANFHPFMADLCELLGVPGPGAAEKGKLGAYEYEASIPGGSFRSTKGTGAIDLYKRGYFIMEAKQSYLKPEQEQLDLDDKPQAPSGARYDKLMRDAWLQARNYARNLPSGEPVAPFLIVCDVGRAFEIYVDPAGNGRDYDFFPDRQSYRIELPDLKSDAEVARTGKNALELLRAIWTEPKKIDPRFQSAEVTRRVAANLAEVSRYMEEGIRIKGLPDREKNILIEESSLFLMRVLFCMFAEDIGLLPERSFEAFLKEADGNASYFENGLRDLFEKMNNEDAGNRFSMALKTDVRYFNGGLFEDSKVFPLGGFLIHNLFEAARQNWRRVEPAIFGTLLEQALDAKERSKLGAHYTPRPYVETLVRATIMDVLEPEWEALQHEHEADEAELLKAALTFHEKVASTRVLDPACGTGNFLYVAMELLQALESRVLDLIDKLGGDARPRVGPQQFYGLELNPRAAKIAELVLWIGWLRNRLRDDPDAVPEPVLKRSANLNMGRRGRYDALLELDETGQFDPDSPKPSAWPEVEFILGNPPFIGKGAEMREQLGNNYLQALERANSRVRLGSDFVMQWWDRAANLLAMEGGALVRFGFVTTNSITQQFNRRTIEAFTQNDDHPISLVFAVPDHPWYKGTDGAAAVRIAMSVAERGQAAGRLLQVKSEKNLDTDVPDIEYFENELQVIHPNLSIGADVTSAEDLRANAGLSSTGMLLAGQGFKISAKKAEELRKLEDPDSDVVKPYVGGGELLREEKMNSVIDFNGLSESEARRQYPHSYEHILLAVKPERDRNPQKSRRENWWLFGRSNEKLRSSLKGLSRMILTTETAKHRVFQFRDVKTVPDHMAITIALDDAYSLGVLQSSIHLQWTFATCSLLGVARFEQGHRYNKSVCFDPFPFPDATETMRSAIAEFAEELDETRKLAIAETPKLTMTELYNLREKLRSGEPLSDKDAKRASTARAGIVDRLHEQLDQAVADAYGWGEEWAAGQLGPSEIVARLVALNHERAAEEAQGHIRWLRPDYQIPRFAPKADD